MAQQRTHSTIARRVAYGLMASVAIVAACSVEPPTAADIAQADASSATKVAHNLAVAAGRDTILHYVLDGKSVTAEQAKAVDPSAIASVNIRKLPNGQLVELRTMQRKRVVGDTLEFMGAVATRAKTSIGHEPIIFIDGVKSTIAALKALNPKSIESVEVIKGAAVAMMYPNEPDAVDGVIQVTTKK